MAYSPERLTAYAAALLHSLGLPTADAELVATALVTADLEGVETHGLGRLPNYLERLRRGVVNPAPVIQPLRDRGATLLLDGDNGMGQVTAARAMSDAIRRAREYGIGWVGVSRSNHFGAASFYCQMAVEQGMLGMAWSNSPPGMVPWGGRTAFLGTNPIAFGFPAGDRTPVLIDLATSVAARGQVLKAAREERPIPLGWAVDSHGQPTESAPDALKGALLPLGGPKGYALALAVEVLVGVLTGAGVGPEIPSFFDNWTEPSNVGHALMAIDISAFMDPAAFGRRMEHLVDGLHAVPPAAGSDGVLVPGERRAPLRNPRRAAGISLPAPVVDQLERFARELGVPGLTE